MKKTRKALVATAVAATILAGGGSAAWALYSWTNHSTVPVSTADAVEPTVTVLNDVSGLLPGQTKSVRIRVENRNRYPLRVTKVAGGNPATGECPAWAVRVTQAKESAYAVTLPRQSQTTLTVQIGMEKWADQKCAGQQLSLDLVTIMTPANGG
jgi:hypothetical protein